MASNISTSNENSLYKYRANMTARFADEADDPITIEPVRFKTIVIDYNYDEFNFPLMYVTVTIPKELQVRLSKHQKTEMVGFELYQYIENSNTPGFERKVIYGQFVYFVSADSGKDKELVVDPNKTEDLGDDVTIGLIAVQHLNYVKEVMNGIVKEGTMSSLLLHLLREHQRVLIEPLHNNPRIKNFIVPPLNSLTKTIRYLNNYSAFYETQYRFFMDYGITYLMSSSGKGVAREGDKCNLVRFNIHSYYDEKNMEGMDDTLKDGVYQFDCSGTYCSLNDSSDTAKSFSQIGGIGTEGDISKVGTGMRDKRSPVKEKVNNVRLPNNNYTLVNNMVTNTANKVVQITISKNKVDSSVMKVYRQFYIDAHEVYGAKYDGYYLMTRKRELYAMEGEGMAMSVILTMNRLADQPT